jgi:MFS family permease
MLAPVKLAALGLIAVAVGIAVGEDGLALVGAIWVVLGTLLWTFYTRYEKELRKSVSTGDPAVDALQKARARSSGGRYAFALVLVLTAGLAPLAIGIAAVGFADGSGWRWVPVAVGGLITLIGLLSAAVRLSGADLEAAAKAGEPQQAATITIEGKRQTGVYINEQPRIEFDLLVEPEGLPSYRVKKKATVPHSALSDIGIGDGFAAKVDPADPDRIAIDWNAPIDGDADPGARLERLEDLRRRDLIDADEYEAQRRRIVESL